MNSLNIHRLKKIKLNYYIFKTTELSSRANIQNKTKKSMKDEPTLIYAEKNLQ